MVRLHGWYDVNQVRGNGEAGVWIAVDGLNSEPHSIHTPLPDDLSCRTSLQVKGCIIEGNKDYGVVIDKPRIPEVDWDERADGNIIRNNAEGDVQFNEA